MTQSAHDVLQSKLDAIRAKFLVLLDDRLDELECLRRLIDQEEQSQNALRQTQSIAHKIYGSAGTLGFTDLGESAAETEEAIIHYLTGKDPIPTLEDTKNIIDSFLDEAADVSSSAYWQSACA